MSTFDHLALAAKPNLYLSAPVTTDQSGTDVITITSNTLTATGQPIIYGHANSFDIRENHTVSFDSNPIFISGLTTEFILHTSQPDQEISIVSADDGSGIFINPYSITLRLNYVKNELFQTVSTDVPIYDWNNKLHVKMILGVNQASLIVNDQLSFLILDGKLNDSISNIEIGADIPTGAFFLLDGLGVYGKRFYDKSDTIDDLSKGHNIYAARVLNGSSTDFSTYISLSTLEVSDKDFSYFSNGQTNNYIYSYFISGSQTNISYVVVRTNDDSLEIEWDINGGTIDKFVKYLIVPITSVGNVITFNLPVKPRDDFSMHIENVASANIESETPARLVATGYPIFPKETSDSIVNCPNGVIMNYSNFTGTWLTSDRADLQVPPQSIELIFKAEESAVIFKSSDGEINTSTQSGYLMWLNGISVADLTDILPSQWNHLVIEKASATATSFDLNSNGTDPPNKISYLLLSSYSTLLSDDQIQQLYQVSIGLDAISVDEVSIELAEGSFENGQPFQLFGNSWAIVGAGGN